MRALEYWRENTFRCLNVHVFSGSSNADIETNLSTLLLKLVGCEDHFKCFCSAGGQCELNWTPTVYLKLPSWRLPEQLEAWLQVLESEWAQEPGWETGLLASDASIWTFLYLPSLEKHSSAIRVLLKRSFSHDIAPSHSLKSLLPMAAVWHGGIFLPKPQGGMMLSHKPHVICQHSPANHIMYKRTLGTHVSKHHTAP